MLTIDGLAQPAPAELRVGYESIGRRETTADGSLAADRLALKRQAHVVWRGLKREEAAQVLSALTQGVFLAVTLPDPLTGEPAGLTMTVLSLEAGLMAVDAEGRPAACRVVTAVLRER